MDAKDMFDWDKFLGSLSTRPLKVKREVVKTIAIPSSLPEECLFYIVGQRLHKQEITLDDEKKKQLSRIQNQITGRLKPMSSLPLETLEKKDGEFNIQIELGQKRHVPNPQVSTTVDNISDDGLVVMENLDKRPPKRESHGGTQGSPDLIVLSDSDDEEPSKKIPCLSASAWKNNFQNGKSPGEFPLTYPQPVATAKVTDGSENVFDIFEDVDSINDQSVTEVDFFSRDFGGNADIKKRLFPPKEYEMNEKESFDEKPPVNMQGADSTSAIQETGPTLIVPKAESLQLNYLKTSESMPTVSDTSKSPVKIVSDILKSQSFSNVTVTPTKAGLAEERQLNRFLFERYSVSKQKPDKLKSASTWDTDMLRKYILEIDMVKFELNQNQLVPLKDQEQIMNSIISVSKSLLPQSLHFTPTYPKFKELAGLEREKEITVHKFLDSFLFFIGDKSGASVKVENKFPKGKLPGATADYAFYKSNICLGVLEAKTGTTLSKKSVAQWVVQMLQAQCQHGNSHVPVSGILTDGFRYVFAELCGKQFTFEHEFNIKGATWQDSSVVIHIHYADDWESFFRICSMIKTKLVKSVNKLEILSSA